MKQTKKLKGLLGMLLALIMVFQMPVGMVRAEDGNIGANDYPVEGEKVLNLPGGTYGTIEVPTGCHLVIEGAVTATTVTLKGDCFLEIYAPEGTCGTLNCEELVVENNANLCLDNKNNVPKVNGTPLELLSWDDGTSGFVDVAQTNFEQKSFHYVLGEGKWYETVETADPADFFLSFEGMEAGIGIRVAYSYGGNDWTYPIDDGTDGHNFKTLEDGDLRYDEDFGSYVYDCSFRLEGIPIVEGVIPVTVKIEVNPDDTSKVLNGPYDMETCIDSQWTIDETAFEYRYTNYTDFTCGSHYIHFAMSYKNAGKKEIVDEVNDYLYAYSEGVNWDGVGSIDADDIKYALASELYVRFINPPLYDDFGIHLPDGGTQGVDNQGVAELADRIELSGNDTIPAINGAGNTVNLTQYTATINWGVDETNGSPVTSVIPIYEIPVSCGDSILICTNFNKDNGTCAADSLYIREIGDISDNNPANDGDMKEFSSSTVTDGQSETKDAGLLVLANYSNVVAGGNGFLTTPMNTDGMYSFNGYHMDWATGHFNGRVNVRVMKPGNDYVVIHGSGETNKVDGMGLNASATDTIWETGNRCTARVYVGSSTLTLMPVENGIVSNDENETKIARVELLDPSIQDGVTITQNGGNFNVTFASNFYDSVPLKITYENGDIKELTIERIGLVINYFYLEDRGHPGDDTGEIEYDCKQGSSLTFDYNYYAGEQIIVYATYYHPTVDPTGNSGAAILHLKYDDGREVFMESNAGNEWKNNGGSGYLAAANGGVATTTFFIDFVEAGNGSSNTTTSIPGFYATVLNAGYNNPTTYGGTQIGSGLGVYWDGEITFATR